MVPKITATPSCCYRLRPRPSPVLSFKAGACPSIVIVVATHRRVCFRDLWPSSPRATNGGAREQQQQKQQQEQGARGSRIRECGSHRLSRQHLNKDAAGKSNTCTWWWWRWLWWWRWRWGHLPRLNPPSTHAIKMIDWVKWLKASTRRTYLRRLSSALA